MTNSMKVLLVLLTFCSNVVLAQTGDSERGALVFQAYCTRCHIPIEIENRLRNDWLGHTGAQLLQRISATMPGENAGSLTAQQYLDVTAFVLAIGKVELPATALTPKALADLTLARTIAATATAAVPSTPWLTLNGDLASTRYTALAQINASNVKDVKVTWRLNLDRFGPTTEGSNVTTPLMVNGTLYATAGVTRDVIALDPATGQLLWL